MVVREACVANGAMLCLAVGAAMFATACATSHAAMQHTRPAGIQASNIRVAFPLEPCVATMLSRSRTFRHTYMKIARRHDIRVKIVLAPNRRSHVRAETDVRSFVGGQRVADIRLHTADDVVELIAHEMEHVLEQVEGTNLLLLSVAQSSDVHRVGRSFETQRGIETGLRVADEVGSTASRKCGASLQDAARVAYSF